MRTERTFAEIEALPPLMRSKARAAYIGKEIDWTATFFTAEMETSKRVFLAFRHEVSDKMLFVHASLTDYPWLQSAKNGDVVRLQGRIFKMGPLAIHLDVVSLTQIAEATH